MMRKVLMFGVAVVLGACASAPERVSPEAAAAKAERPSAKVGDRWKFACTDTGQKSERLWVVASVDPSGVKGTENGKPLAFSPDLNPLASPHRMDSNRMFLSFPLEVGKQWNASNQFVDYEGFHISGSDGAEKLSAKVINYEKVRVAAGEFDAFKLKAQSSWDVRSCGCSGTFEMTYWNAPATRAIVKSEARTVYSYRGVPAYENSCELLEYQLQP